MKIMIEELKSYRVSLWKNRKPHGPPDLQYTTADESLAWMFLYADMAYAGDGSWGKVEQLHGECKSLWAVQKNGKGNPRRYVK